MKFLSLWGFEEEEAIREALKRFLAAITAEWYLFEAVWRSLRWWGEWVRSQRFSRWRRAVLKADKAGVYHSLISSDSFDFERSLYFDKRSYSGIVGINKIRNCMISLEWRMSRVNLETQIDLKHRKEIWVKGRGLLGKIEREEKIGKTQKEKQVKTGEWSITALIEEEVGVITRSMIWWSRWVGKETCWVRLVESRAARNC